MVKENLECAVGSVKQVEPGWRSMAVCLQTHLYMNVRSVSVNVSGTRESAIVTVSGTTASENAGRENARGKERGSERRRGCAERRSGRGIA